MKTPASSILCYIAAGFFTYMVTIIGFVRAPDGSLAFKFVLMGVFSVPGLIALWAGFALAGYQKWKQSFGVILLSGSGFTAFAVFSIYSTFSSPEYREIIPKSSQENMARMADVQGGIIILSLFLISGMLLVMADKKSKVNAGATSNSPASSSNPFHPPKS